MQLNVLCFPAAKTLSVMQALLAAHRPTVLLAGDSSPRWRYSRDLSPAHAGLTKPSSVPDSNGDRKSTRLNSSHGYISYAVFCLKKKKNKQKVLNLVHYAHISSYV